MKLKCPSSLNRKTIKIPIKPQSLTCEIKQTNKQTNCLHGVLSLSINYPGICVIKRIELLPNCHDKLLPHRKLYSRANFMLISTGNYLTQSPIGTEKSGVQRDNFTRVHVQVPSSPFFTPFDPPKISRSLRSFPNNDNGKKDI